MSKNNCPARTLYISLDFFAVPTKQQREETKFQIQITKWVDYHSLSGEGGGGVIIYFIIIITQRLLYLMQVGCGTLLVQFFDQMDFGDKLQT